MDNELPETLSKAKEVLENADKEKMISTTLSCYHFLSVEVENSGVKQRWNVVFSEKAYAKETKTLEKKIRLEKEKAEKEYGTSIIALKAVREMEKGWKYHEISPNEVEVRKEKRRGKLMEEERIASFPLPAH